MTRKRQPAEGWTARPSEQEIIEIVPVGNPLLDFAGAVSYYARLAYPKAEDSRKAEEFLEVLSSWRLMTCRPQLQHATIHIPPKYSRVRTLRNKISKHFRCLERRLTAASIAWTLHWNRFLAQSVPQSSDCTYRLKLPSQWGGTIQARVRRGPTTINKAVQALVDFRMKGTPGLESEDAAVNIKHRVWAESLPVLHLAIALLQLIEGFSPQTSVEDKLLLLLCKTDWLLPTLGYAESLRTFLPSIIPTFHPEKAIRLLPPEVSNQ